MIKLTEQEIIKNWHGDICIPLVSVCTVTYNHEAFIAETIESFLMQKTTFPFEVIIDEDCSTDGTANIIRQYREKYPTIIKANLREKNVGAMQNSSDNLLRAKGKYIAWCEGDDYWTDSLKLQKQVDFLEKNPLYYGCFHDCMRIYEGDNKNKKQHLRIGNRKIAEDVDLASIIDENNIATASIIFRNFTKEMPKSFQKSSKGDYALMVTIAEKGNIKYLNEVMSAYRIHSGGIWSSRSEISKEEESVHFYHLLQEYFVNNKNILNALSKKLKYTYYTLARKLVYDKQRLKSLYYLVLSLDFRKNKYPKIKYSHYFKELVRSFVKKNIH